MPSASPTAPHLSGTWPAWLFCAGLTLLYLGERALAGHAQQVSDVGGLIMVVVGLLGALWRARQRPLFAPIAGHYMTVALGLLLYGCLRFGWLPPEDLFDPERARTVLRVSFVPIILWGLWPALLQERAAASMAGAALAESWRLRLAQRSARITLLGLLSFAGVNYAANVWDRKVDLSYFKTTVASESTRDILRNLSTEVQLTLFFPPSNEVLEQVQSYLSPLVPLSARLRLSVTDQALEPDLARRLRVRGNGYLAMEANGHSELLRLDPDLERARPTLRSLDKQV
ncbi:MAG: hypothetical protein EOO40_05820, partial [Deltaproteobacteria bacterium]